MKMFERIKQNVGSRVLSKRYHHLGRNTHTCNLEKAKKIGVLFNATHTVSFEIIKEFIKTLEQRKLRVDALGYVNSKKLIDHYLYRKGFDFFTKSNLNWYYRPVYDGVDKFINKEYDILFYLGLEESYPLEYIVALSKAKFKVGRYLKQESFLDMMIDMEKENEVMRSLQQEINPSKVPGQKKKEFESEINKKVEIEMQLSFLIQQLMHYLSILKTE
jgi:hypothetical protein